jgi:hypothetical protein
MAFDLSTPESQLAFQIAVNAQKTQDAKARLRRQARNSVSAQLTPYGQKLEDYKPEFNSIYNPAADRQQAEAQAVQRYVVGLPELLSRVQKEQTANGRSSGGGGGTPNPIPFVSQAFDPYAVMQYLIEASKGKTTPIAVAPTNIGGGQTYANTGVYGAVYRTPGAVQPKFQRQINADRFG